MKQVVFCVMIFLFSDFAKAEVKINSFYFNQNGVELTGTSRCLLDELQQYMITNEVQFIEINSFSDIEGDKAANIKLAKQRLNIIVDYLSLDNESAILNVYGAQKVKLNFTPLNWHRVDVYYYLGKERELPFVDIDEIEQAYEAIDRDSVVSKNEIIENQPILLPIKFKGGTVKIQENSFVYVEELYQSLIAHPDLNAHIRGHVCCGNKKYRSKRRAKTVFNYLNKLGISKDRLSFEGYSNSEPLVFPELTEEDRSLNRRVDVIFSKSK